ncbi:hypothetical protein F8388_000660 [Cannabis sativa]|uniref:Myb/SANT-like domain-containing protein n=1 Tax=Cannabis sativa TaxID=3483 RepID=A0A7J6DQL1_CANSA|nr:hypothetical protein G4B88_013267 [Cannabis sativa]KAF4392533.1 hypothetical protein F8388_000660 [Cannabis sativa]
MASFQPDQVISELGEPNSVDLVIDCPQETRWDFQFRVDASVVQGAAGTAAIQVDVAEEEAVVLLHHLTVESVLEDSEVVIIDNSEASVWPEKYEKNFIELMEEEVVKRNRNTTTFTKQSCKRIKEELCAQAKRSYTDKQLRNKYNLLRQKHKDFKSLLKETSIGFSVVAGQVTAPDEYAHPSTLDNDDDDAMSKSPSIRNQESSFDEDGSKRRGKSTSTTSSLSTKKAKFSLALAETLTVYNETAKRKMKMYENSMTSTKHHLLDEYIEALNQIDAISGEVYAKAIEKFESEVSRALFLKMPVNRRIDWLNYLK